MMDLDPDARRLLELTREARSPSARDKARVGRMLAGALAGSSLGVAHAASSGGAGKATLMGTVAKWAGVVLVASGTGVGLLQWRASRHAHPEAPVTVAVVPAKPAEPVVAPEGEVAEPAPALQAASPGLAAPARRAPAARAPDRVAPKTTLPEELDLLHEAQAAWRAGRAGPALELLARHRATYPRSELGPERDALTVLCLCATGRTPDAQKVARRFLKSAHRSPLRTSVEESCAKDR
jgi:hypothetical protein